MAFDHFTLRSLAAEIERYAQTQTVRSVDSGPSHLYLSCGRAGVVYLALGANGYLCHLPEAPKTEGKTLATGERYLRGSTIQAVTVENRDRVIRIRLSRDDRDGVPTYGQLVCELIHPHCQAYLIREQSAQILAHWWNESAKNRKPRRAVGEDYQLPRDRGLVDKSTGDVGLFSKKLHEVGGNLDVAVTRTLVGVDRTTGRELVCRAGCDGDQAVSQVAAAATERLWNEYRKLQELDGGGGFTWKDGEKTGFSAIEPTHQSTYSRVDSINGAVVWAFRDAPRESGSPKDPGGHKDETGPMLARARKKIHKRLEALAADLKEAASADQLERTGNTLMANLHTVPVGATRIVLGDVYDPSGSASVVIGLDPRKSAADNGQWYLKRASKLRRRLLDLPERLAAAETVARKIDEYADVLESGGSLDPSSVRAWLSELRLVQLDRVGQKKRATSAYPRTYTTSLGWTVLAGRNNKENDQLTHRMAAPNDVWFHAHGYAGSHVVLRREDRQEEPGARNLEEAASIAAFWSKGKTAKKVPVIYTTVKYVSKPRGGAPGQAVVRREKTLMVEPRLPSKG